MATDTPAAVAGNRPKPRRMRRWLLASGLGVLGLLAVAIISVLLMVPDILIFAVLLVRGVPQLSFPHLEPEAEFQAIAKVIREGDNILLGRAPLGQLKAELEEPGLDFSERHELQGEYVLELLTHGEVAQALDFINDAIHTADASADVTADQQAELYRWRAIVHLRDAEQQNCIAEHCEQSCLFPIGRGGVHRRRGAAESARVDLQRYLDSDPPDRLEAIWLLNLVNMTLGEYPDHVPPDLLLDPELFAEHAECPRFVDIGSALGINRLTLAGGVVIEDFDRDGRLDILSSSMDPESPLALFHNRGDGTFENVAGAAGLDVQLGGLNCNAADYNNDGNMDILVMRGGWLVVTGGRVRQSLLRNNGDGTFTDVTRSAGLAEPAYESQVGVWGDFDNDGDLDLFCGNESLGEYIPWGSANCPSQFYSNNGDGTFTEGAKRAGLLNYAWCKGAAAGDFDNDGNLDLYVSNYAEKNLEFGHNRLYHNNGDGTFTDVAEELGVTGPMRSFATWFFDFDNDGWLDLFVCPFGATLEDTVRDYRSQPHVGELPKLYRNLEGKGFADVTESMHLNHPYMAMGASFGDLDNDGWLDIYLGTGSPDFTHLIPNVMLRNNAGRDFDDVTFAGGFGHLQKGHGIAFVDLDEDGDQDIYADLGGAYPGDQYTNAFFLNPGTSGAFLKVELVGVVSCRQAIGARVSVDVESASDGPRTMHRAAGCISSFGYLPSRMEIGLGDATRIATLRVEWPRTQQTQEFADVPLNSLVRVTEGDDQLEVLPLSPVDFARHVSVEEDTP